MRSFKDRNGKLLGVIGIDVKQSAISDILSKMKIGNTGYFMIVHKSGIIMADGKVVKNNFKNIKDVKIDGLNKLLIDKVENFNVNIGGEKYLVNPYKVAGTDWILASFMSEKELMAGTKNILMSILIIAIMGILLVSILLYFASKHIADPITKF